MERKINFASAIHEATDYCLGHDPSVYVMGLGVPDPRGIFGTTTGLAKKHGARRVLDMPCAENGMTGVAIGSAIVGQRPIVVFQRMDFALLCVEQIVNQAAKWHYMFGGKMSVPIVLRMIIGRGWGQGPQHSQSLHAWFAHIPGLKVVMPATPHDAKGLLIASVEDNNPVLFLEHRWLHNLSDYVPTDPYRVPLGEARVATVGSDLTIVANSYMTIEAMHAAKALALEGINVEVIDLRTIKPLDKQAILSSVAKTGRLLVVDGGACEFGVSAEIVAMVTETAWSGLKCAPRRLAMPDCPVPTSPALSMDFYPRWGDIVKAAGDMLGRKIAVKPAQNPVPHDVPDNSFTGPF